MTVTWPSLEGSADWIMNTALREPGPVSFLWIPLSLVEDSSRMDPMSVSQAISPQS